MVELFGENYYEENGNQFVFKNLRKGIQFNCDHPYRHLSFHEALEVTNERMFLLFLGIPERYHGCIEWSFYEDSDRYPDSKIEFEIMEGNELNRKELKELQNAIEVATTRFGVHHYSILERIEKDIEYRYSDESIKEELLEDDSIEFTTDGAIYE
jgi:hypothetical protein